MPADHAQDKLGAARAAVPAHEGRQAEHEARKPGESLGGEKEALGVMQRRTGQRRPRLGTMSAVWSWSLHGWKYGIHAGACSSRADDARVTRRSDTEQGFCFLPDQQRYRGDCRQQDQHRDVEAHVRSVARPRPLFPLLPGGSLALVGAANRRRVDWLFLVLGLRLSGWITHQRPSLGLITQTMQPRDDRLQTLAAASSLAHHRRVGLCRTASRRSIPRQGRDRQDTTGVNDPSFPAPGLGARPSASPDGATAAEERNGDRRPSGAAAQLLADALVAPLDSAGLPRRLAALVAAATSADPDAVQLGTSAAVSSSELDAARERAGRVREQGRQIRERLSGALVVTLPLGFEPLGVLEARFSQEAQTSEAELEALQTLAARVAGVLEDSALRRDLAGDLERAQALLTFSGQTMSELALEPTLIAAVE